MFALVRWQRTAALGALCLALGIAVQASSQVTTTLTISGNVAQTLSLTIEDLKRYPAHEFEYQPRIGAPQKTAEPIRHYKGCLLRDVLTAAKPIENRPRQLRKSYIVATASDGYEVVFSWGELFVSPVGDSVFVVYERDGAPLADAEGPIALIALSDTRPVRHVKWLQALTIRIA